MFGRQSVQRFNHADFYIRFDQHFPQKHHHSHGVGEEGEYFEGEFRAMQKVVDRYYHAEIDGDHLRKPRDLVFRGRAGKIKQVEFRHGDASQLSVISYRKGKGYKDVNRGSRIVNRGNDEVLKRRIRRDELLLVQGPAEAGPSISKSKGSGRRLPLFRQKSVAFNREISFTRD